MLNRQRVRLWIPGCWPSILFVCERASERARACVSMPTSEISISSFPPFVSDGIAIILLVQITTSSRRNGKEPSPARWGTKEYNGQTELTAKNNTTVTMDTASHRLDAALCSRCSALQSSIGLLSWLSAPFILSSSCNGHFGIMKQAQLLSSMQSIESTRFDPANRPPSTPARDTINVTVKCWRLQNLEGAEGLRRPKGNNLLSKQFHKVYCMCTLVFCFFLIFCLMSSKQIKDKKETQGL